MIKNIIPKIMLMAFTAMVTGHLAAQQARLSIDNAISIALKNNFDILVAGKAAEISKTNNTPGNAGMLPTVDLTATGGLELNNQYQKLSNGTVNKYPDVRTSALSAGVQLNWTLFDGGKMFITRSKLREMEQLGEVQFRQKVLQVLYNVIGAYYDVVRQKQQMASIRESQSYNREQVKIAEAAFNSGTVAKSDLLQARIDLNIADENIIAQQYIIDAALKYFNTLLGMNGQTTYDINDSISVNYSPDKESLFAKIDTANQDVLALQRQINIAEMALKETRSAYMPNLSVKAGYYASITDNSAGSTLYNRALGPQISGTLSVPLYNAGETKRKTALAKIETETARYDLENLKLQLSTELRNTINDFESQQALLNIEAENNHLTRENLEISIQRFRQGQTTSLEVHQAQEYFVQSSTRLINFRYNLKMAETRLKQMVSEL